MHKVFRYTSTVMFAIPWITTAIAAFLPLRYFASRLNLDNLTFRLQNYQWSEITQNFNSNAKLRCRFYP